MADIVDIRKNIRIIMESQAPSSFFQVADSVVDHFIANMSNYANTNGHLLVHGPEFGEEFKRFFHDCLEKGLVRIEESPEASMPMESTEEDTDKDETEELDETTFKRSAEKLARKYVPGYGNRRVAKRKEELEYSSRLSNASASDSESHAKKQRALAARTDRAAGRLGKIGANEGTANYGDDDGDSVGTPSWGEVTINGQIITVHIGDSHSYRRYCIDFGGNAPEDRVMSAAEEIAKLASAPGDDWLKETGFTKEA